MRVLANPKPVDYQVLQKNENIFVVVLEYLSATVKLTVASTCAFKDIAILYLVFQSLEKIPEVIAVAKETALCSSQVLVVDSEVEPRL